MLVGILSIFASIFSISKELSSSGVAAAQECPERSERPSDSSSSSAVWSSEVQKLEEGGSDELRRSAGAAASGKE